MLKTNFYVYSEDNVDIPVHCNYGKDMLSKILTFKDNTALIDADSDQTMTYAELAHQTVNIALSLTHMGIKRGDVIGICSEKRMEVIPTMLGIICAGTTFSPLDITCGEASFLHRLNISRPTIVFCSPSAYSAHQDHLCVDGVRECVVFGEFEGTLSFSQFLAKTAPVEQFLPADVDGWDDNVLLVFSSGTTGLPKGIPVTHFSFILFNRVAVDEKLYFAAPFLNTREWYYPYGLFHTLACLNVGSTVVFSPRNCEEDTLQAIEKYKIKIMQVCPTTVNELVKSPILHKYDVSSLMYMMSASMTFDAELVKAAKNRFPNLREVYQMYGMAENGLVTNELTAPYGSRAGSVGCVCAGVIVKVVDLNTRKPLGPYQRGEICFKSLGLLKGYLGKVEENYLDEEQFYKSGDIGYYDDDKYFYIVDRAKELIKYFDTSVAPAEFEAILVQHPTVREAGVVGAPHVVCGEVPTAFVVLQPGAKVTADELVAYVNSQISSKTTLVGGVRFVDKLPRGAGEKLNRKALKLML